MLAERASLIFSKQGGKPGGIGARQAVELRKEVSTDNGFGHARLEPLYG